VYLNVIVYYITLEFSTGNTYILKENLLEVYRKPFVVILVQVSVLTLILLTWRIW